MSDDRLTVPTYVYQVIRADGTDGETFEVVQAMADPALECHPETGQPVRRVFSAPQVASRFTERRTRQLLDNKNLARAGFTKYEKDSRSGTYHRTAGDKGPETLHR